MDTKTPNNVNSTEEFFKKFFREFRAGLRIEEQPWLDQLVLDLADISSTIPSSSSDHQYNFREILMLIILLNQKKIQSLMTKKREKN